jgi:predicted deacetylase
MKDIVTEYWLNYKMAAIEFGDKPNDHALKSKFAIVTIHDANPAYSDKISRAINELNKLNIPYNFAIIPHFRKKQENDITKNTEWIEQILNYGQPVALHGLYHEDENGKIEDFHNLDFKCAQEELKKGIEIFDKAEIKTDVFIPPTWAINKYTIDALISLGFNIVETESEIVLLNKNTRLHTDILNWDQGLPQANQLFLGINKRRYKEKVMANTQMVRIAIHPKDSENALQDQKEMINGLKDINYNFLTYNDIEGLFG